MFLWLLFSGYKSKHPFHAPLEKPHVVVLGWVVLTIRNQATLVTASCSCFGLGKYYQPENCLEEEKCHSGVLWKEELAEFRVVLYCVFLISSVGSVTLGRLLRLKNSTDYKC